MKIMEIKFRFEPRDCWIGVFWNIHQEMHPMFRSVTTFYICLIPMLPIIVIRKHRRHN
jgi:hypothetical protein